MWRSSKAAIRAQLEKLIPPEQDTNRLPGEVRGTGRSPTTPAAGTLTSCSRNCESSAELSDEQQRHVRENMTEEELVIFDISHPPSPGSEAPNERREVKQVAKLLLERIKVLLVLDWRQRQSLAAPSVEDAIKDRLAVTGLPAGSHSPELSPEEVLGGLRARLRELRGSG